MPSPTSWRRSKPLIITCIIAMILVGIAVAGIQLARRFLWFGSPPPPADYAAQLHSLACRANGLQSDSQDAWPLFEQVIGVVIDAENAVSGDATRRPDGALRLTIDFTAPLRPPAPDSDAGELALRALREQDQRGLGPLLNTLA